jgi:translation initiation factor 2 subunit 3
MNNTIIMNLNSQPNFNLGTLGSVSDGKSTMIYQLTGIKTQKHSSEKHRNITIKPGYANLKIWFCVECNNYESSASNQYEVNCKCCEESTNLVNHLSFVDCPGHAELILTMMGSVSLMKGAIVIVSAAEAVSKKPQLIQHLIASKMANIDKLIICFNKLDLVTKEVAIERKKELDQLLERLDIIPYTIIPTSFNKRIGIQNLLKAMMFVFPPKEKDISNKTFFRITRSFDINKSGTSWSDINGGIIGGSLIHGELNINDEIEIRPGILSKGKDGKFINQPIITKILSLETDGIQLENLNPGGLVGVGTEIDPYYCKNDMLCGNVMGKIGTLPNVYNEVKLKYKKLDEFEGNWNSKNGDTVFLQIGNVSVESRLAKFNKDNFTFSLLKPACIEDDAKILVCRKDDGILKIVGFGLM